MKRIILMAMILFLITNLSFAADQGLDRKQIYELQEKCGKRCEDMFKKEYGNGISTTADEQMISAYQNH